MPFGKITSDWIAKGRPFTRKKRPKKRKVYSTKHRILSSLFRINGVEFNFGRERGKPLK